ncbi:glutathione synthase [Janthinobacterium psychrotolerans]|uniref:Glutathione synthetase n=1 Tax=Janthinobacterium psychrotolerans TaxID=1747903 RepID=A0A1A7BZM5_9BURK|nr:glutathione synthase [Janthinobacterium psychrotolerans]OBV38952.1 glutathione synthase [Janthinobacterium psychrotolerans]
MKIAFLADPLAGFKTYKDSTFAMMREAARRGHAIYAFEQKNMALEEGIVTAQVQQITLTGDEHDWYKVVSTEEVRLSVFDAIIERKDPPFDMEYVYGTYLLELAEKQGARVFNKPSAIRDNNEKLAIAQFSELTSPTLVTSNEARLRAFHAKHQDVIFKPLDGMGGTGIFRVKADALNLGAIIETLTGNGAQTIMAQRFIADIDKGDKRILVIGGKPVPYCLARIPQGGEVRGNLAAGGKGVAQPLTARDLEIAEKLGPILAARGLMLVGLDVIGDYLTEVNVTSPTCFQEIAQQTGFDVAAMFIDAVEQGVAQSPAHTA